MIKNLGGDWDVGDKVLAGFESSVPSDCPDFSVRWGSGKLGGTTLVFDLGWFKRSWSNFTENVGGYYQIGVNHIGWVGQNTDPSRWEALGLNIVAGRTDPIRRVLVVGQVEDDAQHGLSKHELRGWLTAHTPTELVQRYRPHPQGSEGKPTGELQDDLDWADLVLTYNSTVGLEALRQGIPVISSTNCFYRQLCGAHIPSVEQRYEFFSRLAWSQWTTQEIQDGDAYKFYKDYL